MTAAQQRSLERRKSRDIPPSAIAPDAEGSAVQKPVASRMRRPSSDKIGDINDILSPGRFNRRNSSQNNLAEAAGGNRGRRKSRDALGTSGANLTAALPVAETNADTRDLLRFLPTVLIEQLQRNSTSSAKWREGKEPISGAFLFVDVYGLHDLSDLLPSMQSTDGAAMEKRRQSILDAIVAAFDQLVSIARAHGGDVVKFTGDGMLIVWPFARSGATRPDGSRRAVISACRCALAAGARKL